eukprot:TRINITY_DN12248_c2_g1_i1.p1 TRINITY_DN12248_c2_g1~~TRINITY_DN12248_c2_g1_i1.p1  ORF type:complete len:623 (+),score=145.20 TRINITY_DN12248_c2_g1_i1:55-1923(+)
MAAGWGRYSLAVIALAAAASLLWMAISDGMDSGRDPHPAAGVPAGGNDTIKLRERLALLAAAWRGPPPQQPPPQQAGAAPRSPPPLAPAAGTPPPAPLLLPPPPSAAAQPPPITAVAPPPGAATSIWDGAGDGVGWLEGPCPLDGISVPLPGEAGDGAGLGSLHLSVTPLLGQPAGEWGRRLAAAAGSNFTPSRACWGPDYGDAMVCSGCCDGKHRGCIGHGNMKRVTRMLAGKIHQPFAATLFRGELRPPQAAGSIPIEPLLTEGIAAANAPTPVNCSGGSRTYPYPVAVLLNGQWTRATSNNMAHWLGELMAPLLHAARLQNSEYVLPLVPICPGRKGGRKMRGGSAAHMLVCTAERIAPAAEPFTHLGAASATNLPETKFVSALPGFLGMPWVSDIAPPQAAADGICLPRVVIACPLRHCPTPKYLASQMPTFQRWLSRRYGLSFAPPPPPAPGPAPRRRLLLLVRKPGGTRFVVNHPELAAAAVERGWEVETLHVWRARGAYGNFSVAFQRCDVVASMHGADLALGLALMRQGTVAVEILLAHAVAEDPFYVFQGAGAGVHVLRWLLPAPAVPEWRGWPVPQGYVKDKHSWRRHSTPFSLPPGGFLRVLAAAAALLPR